MHDAGGDGHAESLEDYKALLALLQQEAGRVFLGCVMCFSFMILYKVLMFLHVNNSQSSWLF
jgi:hypothetical protein